jgi:hypothetical protein
MTLQTEKGVGYLNKAAEYQKKYGKCLLILLIIMICVIAGTLIYFLVPGLKKS